MEGPCNPPDKRPLNARETIASASLKSSGGASLMDQPKPVSNLELIESNSENMKHQENILNEESASSSSSRLKSLRKSISKTLHSLHVALPSMTTPTQGENHSPSLLQMPSTIKQLKKNLNYYKMSGANNSASGKRNESKMIINEDLSISPRLPLMGRDMDVNSNVASFFVSEKQLIEKYSVKTSDVIAEECEIIGKAREDRIKKYLKRTKPKQKILGYSKEYLDIETQRLANGVKELIAFDDAFVAALKENDEHLRQVSKEMKLQMDNISLRLMKTKKSEETFSKSLEQLSDQKKQLETERSSLLTSMDSIRKEVEAMKNKESKILTQYGELNLAKNQMVKDHEIEIARLKASHMDDLCSKNDDLKKFEFENSSLKSKVEDLNTKLSEALMKSSSFEAERKSHKSELEKVESEKRFLEKQNHSLEEKLNNRDSHLDKALETFQENQKFSQHRIATLTDDNSALMMKISDVQTTNQELKTVILGWERKYEELEQGFAKNIGENELKFQKLEYDAKDRQEKLEFSLGMITSQYESEREAWTKKSKEMEQKLEQLTTEVNTLTLNKSEIETELQAMKATYTSVRVNTEKEQLYAVNREKEVLKRRVHDFENLQAKLNELTEELFKAEHDKRLLRNEIHNLRGTVRVIARVKPLKHHLKMLQPGTSDIQDDATTNGIVDDETEILEDGESLNSLELGVDGESLRLTTSSDSISGSKARQHDFKFSRLFGPHSTQNDVFDEVSAFIQSSLDGYNVCLFSYGQTGSGKTHTMTGDHFSHTERGIIPRSVAHIMAYKCHLEQMGWKFSFQAIFLEIYNESILDLLGKPSERNNKLDVRDSKTEIIVPNATIVNIESEDDVQHLLLKAENRRRVEKTDMNERSSRSHSVFTLYIVGEHKLQRAKIKGSLSLCDLAGSERLKKSNVSGDRLKETQSINKSLSALADVFSALNGKNSVTGPVNGVLRSSSKSIASGTATHVPYRNSKLTQLLRPCFAGEGKVLMIVNLSSEPRDLQETLCSLRFANQVNQTAIGSAKRQIEEIPDDSNAPSSIQPPGTARAKRMKSVDESRNKMYDKENIDLNRTIC